MSDSPLISVCIPAYNRATLLPALLDSIVSQVEVRYEIVICEDASPEREQIRAVAGRYTNAYPGCISYHENMVNLSIDQQAASNDVGAISNSYYSHARPEILQLVPASAIRILDVGCGIGVLGVSLKSRQTAEVHGVELTSDAARKAGAYLDRVWNLSIESALPELADSYYDCIVAADVLEHVIDPWITLSALKEKLSPNGKMVVVIG